ncbi:succinylglutamate desuccinylase/aspartoacylase family protein [Kordiimonas aestuarii]|uniref:succinylglutamate desuccinylase/aspartoacylase family protein n=1 Tax=Kordiimonas aestuarii TaxID=1005925 RepID=UPI0021D2C7FC|nr:succinylglutamate desuccinylase/aspartoacylase family protein [Kordiimonas aestuarii]
MAGRASFEIAGQKIAAGGRASISLTLPGQSRYTPLSMPLHVIHGRKEGPTLFVSAAIHGDEINGIEIIRQLLKQKSLNRLRGTLLCVPVVNVYGFLHHTRYMPDRRDLNRGFPGSEHGSLTSRVAYVFRKQIIDRSDYGIDLHTGSNHRTNFPHIRANMADPETARLARAFNTAVTVNASLRDGSLRGYAVEKNIPVLLYEAGEALRFDKLAVRAGVRGVLNVLGAVGMIKREIKRRPHVSLEAESSHWVRGARSGLIREAIKLGSRVKAGDRLAYLSDLLGDEQSEIRATQEGVVIGRTNLPIVNEGDALFHVAEFDNTEKAGKTVERFHASLEGLGEGDYIDPLAE